MPSTDHQHPDTVSVADSSGKDYRPFISHQLTRPNSPEGTLFSKYEILYSIGNAHRLQTVVAESSFRTRDGFELDCVAVKITPEIGTAASVVFTYLPAVSISPRCCDGPG